MSTPRPVDVVRFSLGAAALGRPDLLLRRSKGDDGRGERVTVRVLGARYIAQSGAGFILSQSQKRPSCRHRGRPRLREADDAIDLIHAATMVALAAVAPRHRRLALLSAATALGFAAADVQEVISAP